MKAAANSQVSKTAFCTAIIIQHVQIFKKNKENAFAFLDNLDGISLFLKTKNMNQ
jgi:hypothetical protein